MLLALWGGIAPNGRSWILFDRAGGPQGDYQREPPGTPDYDPAAPTPGTYARVPPTDPGYTKIAPPAPDYKREP